MIVGYGEDSLTLAVLSLHLDQLLNALVDDTAAGEVSVLYRPSFGRRAVKNGTKLPCVFGEFDGIVCTPRATYLIETKRTGASEASGAYVCLRPEQLRRHAAMRAYIEEWHASGRLGWEEFVESSTIKNRLADLHLSVPPLTSTLADNIHFALRMTKQSTGKVQDVLLFARDLSVHGPTAAPPTEVQSAGFVVLIARVTTFMPGYVTLYPKPDVEIARSLASPVLAP